MSELTHFISSIPPLTRTLTLAALVMAGLHALHAVPISDFSPDSNAIWGGELHRMLTGFLVPNPQPMQGMMEIYMLYSFSKGVEEGKFRRNLPDYLWYQAIVVVVVWTEVALLGSLGALAPLGSLYSLNAALLSALTYTWSLLNYSQQVNFYFLPIKASLLPAVSLGFRLLVDGTGPFVIALLGTIAAYTYNCLETSSWGPLVQVVTGVEPLVDPSSMRLGTVNSRTMWFYAQGVLSAPAWLTNLVSRVSHVDYTGRAFARGVTAQAPRKSSTGTSYKSGAAPGVSLFKGEGRRLGST